ncbi:MAG: 5-carboxymethyl-2-hydroxymuconate Delta-isomerase [Albidovulum sp.]|nr:5-carboxymethyl-2-hydroxymuconate Delta-isomerase [Albidovulum sp.]
MPHIQIEYSPNLEDEIDFREFCEALRDSAAGTGIFSLAGIRVRAFKCDHWAIADGDGRNGFVDISVRIRGGRPPDAKKRAAQAIFERAQAFLTPALESRPTALSLELREIDPELSPRSNTIRRRVAT